MIKPTLLVLAAGMGSRYGGLKQLDGVGPNGETIMDYSIFDAIRAGFGKVVYVIRHDFEEEFKKHIISKYQDHIKVATVFQSKDILPSGYTCPLTREKPWGTNHAVLMGKSVINEPFAVINADDFYGRYSYTVLAEELVKMAGSNNKYCMVGYRVGNTLSDGGTVARGVCEVDKDKYLIGVTERTKIMRVDGNVSYKDEDDNWVAIDDNTPVSMNMWGFTPDYFDYSESDFVDFLKNNINNPKSEFYIPTVVNKLVENKTASVKVLDTTSKWFGVTYATDKEGVVKNISNLIKAGEYPTKLW